jgi:hypothetical protein
MSEVAKKFIARAPRYVIQESDERFLRFAHQQETERSYTTRLLNISTTGLAFIIDRDCAPSLGDIIKVEFPIGSERFAWWARVARIEEFYRSAWTNEVDPEMFSEEVLIGIRFHNLPEGHTVQIQQEIERKFQELLRREQREKLVMGFEFVLRHFWSLIIYSLSIAATLTILAWLAQSSN